MRNTERLVKNVVSKNDLSMTVNYNLPIFHMFYWNMQAGKPSVK